MWHKIVLVFAIVGIIDAANDSLPISRNDSSFRTDDDDSPPLLLSPIDIDNCCPKTTTAPPMADFIETKLTLVPELIESSISEAKENGDQFIKNTKAIGDEFIKKRVKAINNAKTAFANGISSAARLSVGLGVTGVGTVKSGANFVLGLLLKPVYVSVGSKMRIVGSGLNLFGSGANWIGTILNNTGTKIKSRALKPLMDLKTDKYGSTAINTAIDRSLKNRR